MVHYVNLVFPRSSARHKVCLAEGTMLRDLREQARTIGHLKAPATSLYILRPDPPEHKKTAIEDADGRSDVQVHPSPETQDPLHLIELLVAPPIQYEPPNLIVIPISLDVMDVDLLFETNEIIFCAEPPCTQEELLEELWKVDSLLEGGHFIMLQNRQTGSRKKLLLDEGMRISDLREVAAVYVGCSFNRVRLYSELCHLPVINRYLDHSLVRDIFPCGFTAGIEILPDQIPMAPFQGGAEQLQEQFQESAHRLLPRELRESRESVRSERGTALPQDFPPWFYPREFREPGITEHGPNGFNFAGIQHGVQMKRPTHEASIPHTLLPIDPRIPLYPAANVTRQPPARPAYTVETVYSDTEDEDDVDTIYHESVCPPPRRSPRFVPTTVPPKKKPRMASGLAMDNLDDFACCNCRRTEVPADVNIAPYVCIVRPAGPDVFPLNHARKKISFIGRSPQSTMLCGECYQYLREPTKIANKDVAAIWPAFVWSTLRRMDIGLTAWDLLPKQWQYMWVRSFAKLHHRTKKSLMQRIPHFKELSVACEKDLAALEGLRWAEDLMPREESLIMAEIKCPAGCCEFKHRAKGLPLDIVWEHCLQTELTIYSTPTKRSCTVWFRHDYLVKEHLLGNKDWLCGPAIARSKESRVPEVLCCQHHSVSHKKYMLHPCRSPTGFVASGKASQFVPVSVVPRTIRKAKAYGFSASFEVAKMHGSYFGLDTMFLSEDGGWPHYQSQLAWSQEVLAVAGRKDLKAHISKLSASNKFAPNLAASLISGRDTIFPNWNTTKKHFEKGSTYVGLHDASRLQQQLFFGERESVTVSSTEGTTEEVLMSGTWPMHIIRIHPGGSAAGQPFPSMMQFRNKHGCDTRTGWILVSMIVCVPELWQQVVSAKKASYNWEGWVLTQATKHCFPHLKIRSKGKSIFHLNQTAWELFSEIIQPDYNTGYQPSNIIEKFSQPTDDRYPGVHTEWNEFYPPDSTLVDVTIVIRANRERHRQDPGVMSWPWLPTSTIYANNATWELRYVSISAPASRDVSSSADSWVGLIYARHGKESHPSWWRIPRRAHLPQCQEDGWDISTLPKETLANWNVCVYVRTRNLDLDAIRDQVLSACGGQSRIFCAHHDSPMIVCYAKDKHPCCWEIDVPGILPCDKKPYLVCPHDGCGIAICKFHEASSTSIIGKISLQSGSSNRAILNVPPLHTGTTRTPPDNVYPSVDGSNGHAEDDMRATQYIPLLSEPSYEDVASLQRALQSDDADAVWEAQRQIDTMAGDVFILDAEYGLDDEDAVSPPIHNPGASHSNLHALDVPTTNAGAEAVYGDMEPCDYGEHKMTNHALLNFYGSCLIRRNRKLTGSIAQRAFLQRQVARNPGESIPLVYPEGMLFSDCFFADADNGASVLGALPAALLHGDSVLREHGFAPLSETFRTRLMSPGLLTSSNPKYHFFAFDTLANFSLRGHDSRLILRRGFAEAHGNGGVRLRGNEEPIFDSESIECRSVVNKLAAAIAEEMPTYFYTHTCSMKTHFGMRKLWRWLAGDEVLRDLCTEVIESEIDYWRKSLFESSGTYLLRVWMELIHIWILYISKSPDKPMGTVTKYWCRMELQAAGAKGNLPHMHSLLWTTDDLKTPNGKFEAADRIRGFVDDFVRPAEKVEYIRKGVLRDEDSYMDFIATMRKILPHEHRRRCFVIVQKQGSNGDVSVTKRICKVTNAWRESNAHGEHVFNDIPLRHTPEAIRVMIDIGVAAPSNVNDLGSDVEFIPLLAWLKARKHIPPCHGHEGIISPVIGALVVLNPNCDNCQLTDSYFISRYLAKYISKIDDYGKITIKPPTKEGDAGVFDVKGDELLNTKITSNKIAQQDDLGPKRTRKEVVGLAINVSDTYLKILGIGTIFTNISFVKVSTQSLEYRNGRERKTRPMERIKQHYSTIQLTALTPLHIIPAHRVRHQARLNLPRWRQFTSTQIQKLQDDLYSPISADSVTIFGFRPPELRFVVHQLAYFRWFRRTKINKTFAKLLEYCENNFTAFKELEKTSWICGGNFDITVRAAAMPELITYLRSAPLHVFGDESVAEDARATITSLFLSIEAAVNWEFKGEAPAGQVMTQPIKERYRRLVARFVCDGTEPYLPTAWFTPVKPAQPVSFLIHLIFTFGQFIDEYDLFATGSLRTAFIKAKLLDEARPQESATYLMQKYFHWQLKGLPCGTPAFDMNCVQANSVINAFFMQGSIYSMDAPASLYCRLRQESEASVGAYRSAKDFQFVTTTVNRLREAKFETIPEAAACLAATRESPLSWNISELPKTVGQPPDSHSEQQRLLSDGMNLVNQYMQADCDQCVPGLCVVGGGGVGKTTVALIIALYARSQGLQVTATAMMSERAQELGVTHLNFDYAIPKVDFTRVTPGQLAERMIAALYRCPERLEYIRTTDVEFLDELGNISAELLAAKDITNRYLRNSSRPNGGMLQLATQDHLQLHPVNGTHPLLSPFLTATYVFRKLESSMRAAKHKSWLRIQAITRMSQHQLQQQSIRSEFIHLVVKNCSFVKDWKDVPSDALFVFGKNKPTKILEQAYCAQQRQKAECIISWSTDLERNYEGRFIAAHASISMQLDNKIREQNALFLIQGARYRITYNQAGVVSNGQLAFLLDLPSEEQVKLKQPIDIWVGPPGCRYLPSLENDNKATLLEKGWTLKQLGVGPERTSTVGRFCARRTNQYGLQLYLGSTWHSTMGQTLRRLATKIEAGSLLSGPYAIWDACQVVVMLSRTCSPKDTYFVTDNPRQTARILFQTLTKTSSYRAYLAALLDSLCGSSQEIAPVVLDHSSHIFRPRDVVVPTNNGGCAYILLSLKDLSTTYIGSTNNLVRRFNAEHNAGFGSRQTSSTALRPWAILAFVTGFNGVVKDYVSFENQWIAAKNRLLQFSPDTVSVEAIVHLAKDIIIEMNRDTRNISSLKLVHGGTLQKIRQVMPNHIDPVSRVSEESPLSQDASGDSPIDIVVRANPDAYEPFDNSDDITLDTNEWEESSSTDEGLDGDIEAVQDSDAEAHEDDEDGFDTDDDLALQL